MTVSVTGPDLGRSSCCEPILRALPEWFGIEEATAEYVRDIETLPTLMAQTDGRDVGFLSLKRHFDRAAEVHCMGIVPEYHRRGIGRALQARAEAWCLDEGIEYLQVKTLGPSRVCEHYARTRAFYRAVGFEPLEELKTLWNEANPCLMLVKRLTR